MARNAWPGTCGAAAGGWVEEFDRGAELVQRVVGGPVRVQSLQQMIGLASPQRPTYGKDVVGFVQELVNPRPGQAHPSCRLPHARDRAIDTQTNFRELDDLGCTVVTQLLDQRNDEALQEVGRFGQVGSLQAVADPTLDPIHVPGN